MTEKAPESALPLGPSTVAGVPVVTIPLSEYENLLSCRQIANVRSGARLLPPPSRSPIENDRELCDFLDARLGRMLLKDVVAECAAEFGERAPSKSAVHRYHMRHRASIS